MAEKRVMEERSDRQPRTRKRFSCEIEIDEGRYSGIAIDVSANGMYVQTNAKPKPGSCVDLSLQLPGESEPVRMQARVVRKKVVPPQLSNVAQGGIGLRIDAPSLAYLAFVEQLSPEQADAARQARARLSAGRGSGGGGGASGGAGAGAGGSGGGAGSGSGAGSGGEAATVASGGASQPQVHRYRIHAVDVNTGHRNAYLASCGSEEEASAQVLEQLGEHWKVIFVERV